MCVCVLLQNQTSLFNLYGITEVSCWASCEAVTADQLRKMREEEKSKRRDEEEAREGKEKEEEEDGEEGDISRAVSLGQPLSGTSIELRDERGNVVTSAGMGRIWIGNLKLLIHQKVAHDVSLVNSYLTSRRTVSSLFSWAGGMFGTRHNERQWRLGVCQ